MKRENEVKEQLIANAIHLVAEGGFEKATTKGLTLCSGHLSNFKMNEVYIYRIFGSKEKLFEAAFCQLDTNLFYALRDAAASVGGFRNNTKEAFYNFFVKAWAFILENEENCRCYVRYYYSIYFKGSSLEAHRTRFNNMIAELASVFKEEADVPAILHSVFTAMLNFAIRVFNGEIENTEANQKHIANVLFCMMTSYFKDSVKVS